MSTALLLRLYVGTLVVVMLGVSGYHRRRADRAGGRLSPLEDGWLLVLVLRGGGLVAWLIVLGYVFGLDVLEPTYVALPLWLRVAGAGLMTAVLPLGVWVLRSLGDNITPTSAARDEATLVTSGPYRWVRHPLYSVGFLLWLGMALVTGSWLLWLVLGLAAVGIVYRTPREEARLIARFGDEYRDYMAGTGRFVPRLRGAGGRRA